MGREKLFPRATGLLGSNRQLTPNRCPVSAGHRFAAIPAAKHIHCMTNIYAHMTRAQLAAAYVEKVGYDPFQDDPQATEAEIAQTLAEWDAECAACTVDFVNEALAKRGLDPLDEEQAYLLANPTVDPEQTEGVWEDLHRMGVEVAQ